MKDNKPTPAAYQFYNMMALYKIGNKFATNLIEEKNVAPALKQELGYVVNKIRNFERKALANQVQSDQSVWNKEWSERDYEVFNAVFMYMADMNEEQRSAVEEFTQQLSKGEVKIVHE